jgi:hypothetical protein
MWGTFVHACLFMYSTQEGPEASCEIFYFETQNCKLPTCLAPFWRKLLLFLGDSPVTIPAVTPPVLILFVFLFCRSRHQPRNTTVSFQIICILSSPSSSTTRIRNILSPTDSIKISPPPPSLPRPPNFKASSRLNFSSDFFASRPIWKYVTRNPSKKSHLCCFLP